MADEEEDFLARDFHPPGDENPPVTSAAEAGTGDQANTASSTSESHSGRRIYTDQSQASTGPSLLRSGTVFGGIYHPATTANTTTNSTTVPSSVSISNVSSSSTSTTASTTSSNIINQNIPITSASGQVIVSTVAILAGSNVNTTSGNNININNPAVTTANNPMDLSNQPNRTSTPAVSGANTASVASDSRPGLISEENEGIRVGNIFSPNEIDALSRETSDPEFGQMRARLQVAQRQAQLRRDEAERQARLNEQQQQGLNQGLSQAHLDEVQRLDELRYQYLNENQNQGLEQNPSQEVQNPNLNQAQNQEIDRTTFVERQMSSHLTAENRDQPATMGGMADILNRLMAQQSTALIAGITANCNDFTNTQLGVMAERFDLTIQRVYTSLRNESMIAMRSGRFPDQSTIPSVRFSQPPPAITAPQSQFAESDMQQAIEASLRPEQYFAAASNIISNIRPTTVPILSGANTEPLGPRVNFSPEIASVHEFNPASNSTLMPELATAPVSAAIAPPVNINMAATSAAFNTHQPDIAGLNDTMGVPDHLRNRLLTNYSIPYSNLPQIFVSKKGPEFDGTQCAFQFLDDFGKYIRPYHENPLQIIQTILPSCLKGEASQWYEDDRPNWLTIADWEKAFQIRFCKPVLLRKIKLATLTDAQGLDEPIFSFLTKKNLNLQRYYPSYDELTRVDTMINLLNPFYASRLQPTARESYSALKAECYRIAQVWAHTKAYVAPLGYSADRNVIFETKPQAKAPAANVATQNQHGGKAPQFYSRAPAQSFQPRGPVQQYRPQYYTAPGPRPAHQVPVGNFRPQRPNFASQPTNYQARPVSQAPVYRAPQQVAPRFPQYSSQPRPAQARPAAQTQPLNLSRAPQNQGAATTRRCFNCQEIGHYSNVCPKPPTQGTFHIYDMDGFDYGPAEENVECENVCDIDPPSDVYTASEVEGPTDGFQNPDEWLEQTFPVGDVLKTEVDASHPEQESGAVVGQDSVTGNS